MLDEAQDTGDRRSGIERRRFTYTIHIPERRSGEDRRSGLDRRKKLKNDHKPAMRAKLNGSE